MADVLAPYVEIVMKERFWSWTLVGIIYLILAFTVRGWFTGSIVRRIRGLTPAAHQAVRKGYLKRALWGWFFFFLPLAAVAYLWNESASGFEGSFPFLVLILAAVSFVFSILVHLKAFAASLMDALEKNMEEKEVQAVVRHPA